MRESRKKLAAKSITSGILGKIVALILGFISRTIFIYFLGNEYLGINGLFTNILSVLSFAELGFGSAMTFALYKPVAQNNKVLTLQLLDYFKKVYRVIILVITILGLGLAPFLQYLVKGAEDISILNLTIYYMFFLVSTIVSYFVTYKFSYVNALQKNYIVTNIETILNSLTSILQIISIVIFKNFLVYLAVHTLLLILSRVCISIYLNRKFPLVKEKSIEKLPEVDRKNILTNVRGLAVHQFSSIAVHSTDNIIISSVISVVLVGYVSNYNLLITSVTSFLTIVFSSFSSAFGNIYATESKEFFYDWFNKINFLNFWAYGFCCVAFFVLIPPFITLWIGGDKLIDIASFILIIINTYFVGQGATYNLARNVVGNFSKDKWYVFFHALINLVVSIPCAIYMGLVGVYVGTIISRIFITVCRPLSTFKMMFGKSPNKYYLKLIYYFFVTVVATILTYLTTNQLLLLGDWEWFFLSCVIVVILPNIIFLLGTFWTKDFKLCKEYIFTSIKNILNKRKGKIENDKKFIS